MKHFSALPGDDIKDTCHKLYYLTTELNEPILSHFNGVTIIMTPDNEGTEHAQNNIDLIPNHWIKHDFEKYISEDLRDYFKDLHTSTPKAKMETYEMVKELFEDNYHEDPIYETSVSDRTEVKNDDVS